MNLSDFIVDYGLYVAYAFFGFAVLLAIVFPAIQMIRNFKGAVKTLIAVAVVALLFLLCYSMSVAEPLTSGEQTVSAGTMKIVEAWIYMAYIILGGAILSAVVAPLSRYIK